jgi:hypothetical protein
VKPKLRRGGTGGSVDSGINPQDNCEEQMEFVELHSLLLDAKVDHITEAARLAILVRDVSTVLTDLGLSPISGIHALLVASWK